MQHNNLGGLTVRVKYSLLSAHSMNTIGGVNVRSVDLRPHTLCKLNEHGKLLMKCETTVLYLLKDTLRGAAIRDEKPFSAPRKTVRPLGDWIRSS